MASDEILQSLGFDVRQALQALDHLDAGFTRYEAKLKSSSAAMRDFNSVSGHTLNRMKALTRAARELSAANAAITPPSTAATNPAARTPSRAPRTDYIKPLRGDDARKAMDDLLGITRSAPQAAAASKKAGQQIAAAMNSAHRSTAGFAISWETMTRVVMTQVVVRAFHSVKMAIEDSFEASLEFNTALSEMQTLARDQSIAQLGKQVYDLANAFNLDLMDAAQAKYEILQDGFVSAAQQAEVFSGATRLSKTAVTSLADSVGLVSGTLNAFSLEADQAETIAAKMFRTIDAGRVSGTELARGFGRVSPLLETLGADLDEGLAMLATITRGGVPANEALTQVRGAMNALIKPSDRAKQAMRSLGAETGQQLIKQYGLVGAFKALIAQTDGSEKSIGELFRNVRAFNGIVGITGERLSVFEEILHDISNTDVATFDDIFSDRMNTDTEKLLDNLNDIRRFFTVEVGQGVQQLLGRGFNIVEAETIINGLRALMPLMAQLGGVVGSVAGLYGLYSVNAKIATASMVGLYKPTANLTKGLLGTAKGATAAQVAIRGLAGVTQGAAAGMVAGALGDFIGQQYLSALEQARKAYDETQDKRVRKNRATMDKLVAQEMQAATEISRGFEQLLAEKRKLYNQDVVAASEANRQQLTQYTGILDRIAGAYDSFANAQANRAKSLAQVIAGSQQRQADLLANLDDRQFNRRNIGLDDYQKEFRLQKRAAQLAQEASRSLAGATTKEQQDAALNTFRRAQSAAQEAEALATSSGHLGRRLSAEKQLDSVLKSQVDAERKMQASMLAQQRIAERLAAKGRERVDAIKNEATQFLRNSRLTDDKGLPFSTDKLLKNRAAAEKNLQNILDQMAEGGQQVQAADLLAFDDLSRRLNSAITKEEFQELRAAPSAINDLRDQIKNGLDGIEVLVRLVPDQDALREAFRTDGFTGAATDASRQMSELVSERQELLKHMNDALELQDKRLGLAGKEGQAVAAIVDSYTGLARQQSLSQRKDPVFRLDGTNLTQVAAEYLKLRESILSVANSGDVTREKILELGLATDRLRESGASNTMLAGLSQGLARLMELMNVDQSLRTDFLDVVTGGTADQLQAIEVKLQNIRQGLDMGSLGTAMQPAVTSTAEMAANLERAANYMSHLRSSAMTMPVNQALGGKIKHFNAGGLNRGIDTVPAMLAPGEFVMNPASSRKFHSQLVAMNAGIQPQYHSEGGSVTNIGDVSITVNESKGPQTTAREIMRQINREQRRGSSRLR